MPSQHTSPNTVDSSFGVQSRQSEEEKKQVTTQPATPSVENFNHTLQSENPAKTQKDLGHASQKNNPLHGVTLEKIVSELHDYYGWQELGQRIRIQCFISNPSLNSSLRFLRRAPWAREKVEGLYLYMLRERKRNQSSR